MRTLLRGIILCTLFVVFGTQQVLNDSEQVIVEVPVEVQVVVFPKVTKGSELWVEASAYTYGDGEPGDKTFTGLPADRGIVAVDPRLIPMGTIVWIEGYGYGVTADTGGAIKGNKVDLFFTSRDAAMSWGVRNVKMVVIQPTHEGE